ARGVAPEWLLLTHAGVVGIGYALVIELHTQPRHRCLFGRPRQECRLAARRPGQETAPPPELVAKPLAADAQPRLHKRGHPPRHLLNTDAAHHTPAREEYCAAAPVATSLEARARPR